METSTEPGQLIEQIGILLAIGVGLIVLSVCILLGNSLIIIAISRYKRLQTITNMFVLSLACADFSAGIGVVWEAMFSFYPEMEFQPTTCLSRFVQVIPSYSSVLHLLLIAADRYLAILHPLRYPELMTVRLATVLITVAWSLAVSFGGVLLATANFVPGQSICILFSVVPHAVLIVVFNVVFGALVLVIFYLYTGIFLAARNQIRKIDSLDVGKSQSGTSAIRKEIKTAKQLVFVVFTFVATNSPGFVVSCLGYDYDRLMSTDSYVICYKLALFVIFFNSLMNPVVYAWKSRQFREAFLRVLSRRTWTGGDHSASLTAEENTVTVQRVSVKSLA